MAQYFSNKMWMRMELMICILNTLNNRFKAEQRNVLLFLENVLCYPSSLVAFLPKNTTSRTQPLDAGIIKSWKICYRKRLMRPYCRPGGWGALSQQNGEVSQPPDVICKCFRHVGMLPLAMGLDDNDDDPFF